ncbi:MAG: 5'/3'-nucleotidase SurE [Symploca sp. SIO2D2]|nr:5'/3'-nucleotidase SurE [Symploca sp. SIO2D2]
MHTLITNDDGITSPFLRPLVDAFAKLGPVTVAAPATEQSWIGKGMSRFKDVFLEERDDFNQPAYTLSGTPSDCVNIALAHICESKPDLVVSGINIGHNTGLPFIAASGTVAGALEGALHSLPAIAASLALPPEQYEKLKEGGEELDPFYERQAEKASEILAQFAKKEFPESSESYAIVQNFNFPYTPLETAQIRLTVPARKVSKALFEKTENAFTFSYNAMEDRPISQLTDLACLQEGDISHSILDYTKLS